MNVGLNVKGLTSRHLLHEDLDEAVLADGAEVLNDVLVLEVFVQGDFFMQRLRISADTQTSHQKHEYCTLIYIIYKCILIQKLMQNILHSPPNDSELLLLLPFLVKLIFYLI